MPCRRPAHFIDRGTRAGGVTSSATFTPPAAWADGAFGYKLGTTGRAWRQIINCSAAATGFFRFRAEFELAHAGALRHPAVNRWTAVTDDELALPLPVRIATSNSGSWYGSGITPAGRNTPKPKEIMEHPARKRPGGSSRPTTRRPPPTSTASTTCWADPLRRGRAPAGGPAPERCGTRTTMRHEVPPDIRAGHTAEGEARSGTGGCWAAVPSSGRQIGVDRSSRSHLSGKVRHEARLAQRKIRADVLIGVRTPAAGSRHPGYAHCACWTR